MDDTKHTPTPWSQMGTHIYSSGKSGGNICSMSEPRATTTVEYAPPEYGSKDADEMWANAALIVRAVNTHADLVRALELCVEELSIQAGVGTEFQYDADHPAMIALDAARAAISKAEGR